ncbi:MAG: trigger factor [Candidatus Pacebacteria bacterium]|nr:trigger factor [Candidatus Paceibacterota bacterium]
MKIGIKKQSKTKVEIDFELSWEEFEVYYQKAINKISQGVSLDGFRQGKAPKDIVEQKVGDFKILEQAGEIALQENYLKIVKENNLEVIGPPQIEIKKLAKDNEFQAKIKLSILSEVDLPDYQKIVSKIEKKKSKVEDQEIEETIKWIQKSRANMQEVEKGAVNGNWVEIEYQSPQIENNKLLEDSFILGEAKLIPGFEQAIEGMKKGEEKEFSAVFPKDYYHKELSEKKADFKLKIKAVKTMDLPELNDDFAKTLGNFESFEKLKENIKEGLGLEKENQSKEIWKDDVLKAISDEIKVEMPEILVLSEKERIMHHLEHEAEHLKISFEDYLKRIQKTKEQVENEAMERAIQGVKNYLILKEIGKKESIEVLEKDIEEEINKILASYPQTNFKEIDKESVKSVLYNNKVFSALEKFCDK